MKRRILSLFCVVVFLTLLSAPIYASSIFNSSCVLAQTDEVDDAYLKNTLFVGDSRIQGLGIACSSTTPATFFGVQSCTASQIDTREGVSMTVNGVTKTLTIIDAIKQDGRQFERVYMMFGINELGSGGGTSAIICGYKTAVSKVREVQPTAQICIMGVMPVFNSCSYVSGYTGEVANPKILALNEALITMAEELEAYYLDTYHLFATSDGQLRSDASKDGIHLTAAASREMMEYIKTHAIPSKSVTPFSAGDLNGDGRINATDGVLLAQLLAGWSVQASVTAADCNGDGAVNATDGVLLAQHLAGWAVVLG